ncbi:MAG: hypothetical protein GHCLOJNM_00918 [bacterium]|nr:hypothetical protein [bacterium]
MRKNGYSCPWIVSLPLLFLSGPVNASSPEEATLSAFKGKCRISLKDDDEDI